jgi:hypothetical protein
MHQRFILSFTFLLMACSSATTGTETDTSSARVAAAPSVSQPFSLPGKWRVESFDVTDVQGSDPHMPVAPGSDILSLQFREDGTVEGGRCPSDAEHYEGDVARCSSALEVSTGKWSFASPTLELDFGPEGGPINFQESGSRTKWTVVPTAVGFRIDGIYATFHWANFVRVEE